MRWAVSRPNTHRWARTSEERCEPDCSACTSPTARSSGRSSHSRKARSHAFGMTPLRASTEETTMTTTATQEDAAQEDVEAQVGALVERLFIGGGAAPAALSIHVGNQLGPGKEVSQGGAGTVAAVPRTPSRHP